MRIRATILTPVLAVFTVVALIGTGIVINQMAHQDATATAIAFTPDVVLATTTTTAPVAEVVPTQSPEPAARVSVRSSSGPSNPVVTNQEEEHGVEHEVEPEEEPDDEEMDD